MSTTVMTIKTDKKVKESAQKLAKEMGFPLGTLINAFLRQFVKTKTVYFTNEPYQMSKWLEKEMKSIAKDIEKGKNLSPSFDNIEDAIKYLNEYKDDNQLS